MYEYIQIDMNMRLLVNATFNIVYVDHALVATPSGANNAHCDLVLDFYHSGCITLTVHLVNGHSMPPARCLQPITAVM